MDKRTDEQTNKHTKKRMDGQTEKQRNKINCNRNFNKLAPYGTGGRLLLTANFKVM